MNLNESIGKRISLLRKQHHMTQEQLAERLDISTKHCSCVERGITSLSLERLIDICDIFDVSMDFLIRGIQDFDPRSLPPSLIRIFQQGNPNELELLDEYLKFYTRLRES